MMDSAVLEILKRLSHQLQFNVPITLAPLKIILNDSLLIFQNIGIKNEVTSSATMKTVINLREKTDAQEKCHENAYKPGVLRINKVTQDVAHRESS